MAKPRSLAAALPVGAWAPLECDANDCAIANTDFGFWGVGPRVGASGGYRLPWGFSLFGQVAGALRVGEKESEWGRFSLDVGYEFQNYFDAFERLIWNQATAPASVSENTSNFALDGIYVRSALEFDGP